MQWLLLCLWPAPRHLLVIHRTLELLQLLMQHAHSTRQLARRPSQLVQRDGSVGRITGDGTSRIQDGRRAPGGH